MTVKNAGVTQSNGQDTAADRCQRLGGAERPSHLTPCSFVAYKSVMVANLIVYFGIIKETVVP